MMTLEQRKNELVNWIKELDNESLLLRIEELKTISQKDVSEEIMNLLHLSNQAKDETLIKHTSVRELLKK